jgi:hypothetical protein
LFDIGIVTDEVLEHLENAMAPLMVGDGVAPAAAGWIEGTPNSEAGFVEYLVLKYAGSAGGELANTPLCSTNPVLYRVGYSLASYALDRRGADALAEASRDALALLPGRSSGGGDSTWASVGAWMDSFSGASRDDSTNPKLWTASTNFHLNVARNR